MLKNKDKLRDAMEIYYSSPWDQGRPWLEEEVHFARKGTVFGDRDDAILFLNKYNTISPEFKDYADTDFSDAELLDIFPDYKDME